MSPWFNSTRDYICPHFFECKSRCYHAREHEMSDDCKKDEYHSGMREEMCSSGYSKSECICVPVLDKVNIDN